MNDAERAEVVRAMLAAEDDRIAAAAARSGGSVICMWPGCSEKSYLPECGYRYCGKHLCNGNGYGCDKPVARDGAAVCAEHAA